MLTIVSVVTSALVSEYRLFRFSVELYHPKEIAWSIRCDAEAAIRLADLAFLSCETFSQPINFAANLGSELYQTIMLEKMKVMSDAWRLGADTVLYCDVDLVVTGDFLKAFQESSTDLVLSPNYYASGSEYLCEIHGRFNGGIVLARDATFSQWWTEQTFLLSRPFADQLCLNKSQTRFSVGVLSSDYNIGPWRSITPGWNGGFYSIPSTCKLLHVHLFRPYSSARGWIDRAFSLFCLRYLDNSSDPNHRTIANYILSGEHGRYYRHLLEISRLCFGNQFILRMGGDVQ